MNFLDYPKIETEHLILRQIQNDDVDIVFELRSNAEVNKHIARKLCKDKADAQAHVEKVIILMKNNKSITWVIALKNENVPIGTICLWNFSKDRKVAEVGYDLLPKHQKKGYMTTALKAILQFGFKMLQFKTIEAYTSKHNKGSIALLEKNNFILEPDCIDEDYLDNNIFSLSANNFN